jgi:hypothetical protein
LVALPHVGYDYMNARLVHDQTRTGCSDIIMGCTQDEQDLQDESRLRPERAMHSFRLNAASSSTPVILCILSILSKNQVLIIRIVANMHDSKREFHTPS